MRVCLCATVVPFVSGGAELLVSALERELAARWFDTMSVVLPWGTASPLSLLRTAMAWRMLDLCVEHGPEIDLVIATRFPSYLIQHPRKVVWLVHQLRQAYDLDGTRWGSFSRSPEDRRAVEMVRAMDRRGLGEARTVWTISENVGKRLHRYCGLDFTPLYPPPALDGRYRTVGFGDFVLAVGRLDPLKRFDLVLEAMAATGSGCHCRIAGEGPDRPRLERMIAELGLGERVRLLGRVPDEELLQLYATCGAVVYPPYDEDYGYVTIEAFRSGKPVVTADDSGGVTEFVEDGVTGYVAAGASPRQMARAIDRLVGERALAERLGEAGRRRVAGISWDDVIEKLTGLPPERWPGRGNR
jgi:glycosyltransferase involved in cell wall biosynthesis